jgi:O-antigen/teichoic acid export membrane protein
LAANALVLLVAGVAILPLTASPLRFNLPTAKSLLGYGLRSHGGNVSGLLNERLDQLLIAVFLAPARLGIYVVAVTMTSLTTLIGSSVAMVALPTISRLTDATEKQAAVRHFVWITFLASAAVTIPLILLSGPLLRFFFGEAYSEAGGVTRILLPASIALSTNRALSASLRGLGYPADAGISEFIALGVTVVGLAILLPTIGLTGAAIASLLAYTTSSGWQLRRLSRRFQTPLTSAFLGKRP